jgi:predicted transcriptional regulator
MTRDAYAYTYSERDPIGPDGSGRATVVNGRGFKWQRFHRDEVLTWVQNPVSGKMVGLTPIQLRVYLLCKDLFGQSVTMTSMANDLHVSVSTVSRALVKLTWFGLITYLTGRGRSARTFIQRAFKDDGMDRFRRKASATIHRWSEAQKRRLSRLQSNLAPYFMEGGSKRTDSLGNYLEIIVSKDARFTQPWTPEDLREAGII